MGQYAINRRYSSQLYEIISVHEIVMQVLELNQFTLKKKQSSADKKKSNTTQKSILSNSKSKYINLENIFILKTQMILLLEQEKLLVFQLETIEMTYSGMLWMVMPHHSLLSTCRLEELNPQMICTTVRQYFLPPHHF